MELKIGEVSRMTGLSASGIRFLEEKGLITPTGGRRGKYRSYSLDNVCELLDYRGKRMFGLSQGEIIQLARSEDPALFAELIERRCLELEDDLLETMRLLRFMHRKSREAGLVGNREKYYELAIRPAIIWRPLLLEDGSLSVWPGEAGFEIPYSDSFVRYSADELAEHDGPLPGEFGVGLLEADSQNACFLGEELICYYPEHFALHAIVEVDGAFRLPEEEGKRLREKLAALRREGYIPAAGHPILSRRVYSHSNGDSFGRFDMLWIDLEKA